MTETPKKPALSKLERRAKALRDNLKKRKQQQAKRDMTQPKTIVSDISLEEFEQLLSSDDQNQKRAVLSCEVDLNNIRF